MKFFDTRKKESDSPVSDTPAPAPSPPPTGPLPPREEAAPAPSPPVSAPTPPGQLTVPVPKPVVATPPVPEEVKPAPPPGKTVIGGSAVLRGDIVAQEDLVVNGVVEGSIQTSRDVLIGPDGKIRADIRAAGIIIQGQVLGNVEASRKISLEPSSRLQGNIYGPRLTVSDTAIFNGRIEMTRKPGTSKLTGES